MNKEEIINRLLDVHVQMENLKHQEAGLRSMLTVVGQVKVDLTKATFTPAVAKPHKHPRKTRSFASRRKMSESMKAYWQKVPADVRRAHGKKMRKIVMNYWNSKHGVTAKA